MQRVCSSISAAVAASAAACRTPARTRVPRTVLVALALLLAAGSSLSGQSRSGWFHVLYVDPPRGQRPPAPLHGLVYAQGRWTSLVIDDAVLRAAGGPRALDGRRVSVSGNPLTGAT